MLCEQTKPKKMVREGEDKKKKKEEEGGAAGGDGDDGPVRALDDADIAVLKLYVRALLLLFFSLF